MNHGRLSSRSGVLVVVVGLSIASLSSLAAQDKTDFTGHITSLNWLVLGPFANPFGCGNNEDIISNHISPSCIRCQFPEVEDEIEYDPDLSVSTAYVGPLTDDGNPFWREFNDGTDDGDQDLDADVTGNLSDVMSWMVTYIENEGADDMVVDLCVGSDDGVQIWLDDALAWSNNACRGRNPDCQDIVPEITITPGPHRLAIAAWERGGGWGLSLALQQNGTPIRDGESDLAFLGIERPDGIVAAEDCKCECPPVTGLTANKETGVVVWELPDVDLECPKIKVLLDGVEVAEIESDATSYTIPEADRAAARSVCIDNGTVVPPCTPLVDPQQLCPSVLSCSKHPDGVAVSWKLNGIHSPETISITRDGDPIEGSPFPGATEFVVDEGATGAHVYAVKVTFTAPFEGLDCPALECAFDPSAATTFLFDDFESYTNDQQLTRDGGWEIHEVNNPVEISAVWTVQNKGNRSNPPTEDGSPTGGRFMISDSDCCGGEVDGQGTGRSHDLWTPEFDTTGSDSVWLHFDVSAQLNNNGTCVFDVDVSIDGGEEWDNVFRRVAPSRGAEPLPDRENTDGFFGRLHVDLADFASNESSVIVRFRHFEPDWDWWIAIDNVLIDTVAPPEGGAEVLLEMELFDDLIPDDWEVRSELDNEDPSTWIADDFCFRDPTPGVSERGINRQEAPYAIIDAGCAPGPKDEYLITPSIDCSRALDVFLHFKSEILADKGAVQQVVLSLDGGESFEGTPIFSYDPRSLYDSTEEPFFADRILSVPAAAGEANVAFAFHYRTSTADNWWTIDDVMVTANVTPGTDFRRGDAGDNGTVNISSAILILSFLFTDEVSTLPCMEAGDINNDGSINITDPVNLLNHLFGPQPPPGPPGLENCGPDPDEPGSPGDLGCEQYTTC